MNIHTDRGCGRTMIPDKILGCLGPDVTMVPGTVTWGHGMVWTVATAKGHVSIHDPSPASYSLWTPTQSRVMACTLASV